MKIRRRPKRTRHLVVGCFAVLALLSGAAASAGAQRGNGQPNTAVPDWANGERAIAVLGERLPDVARAYGLRSSTLQAMFRGDPTLFVDGGGELLYVEEATEERLVEPDAADLSVVAAPPTDDAVFFLASRPGADHTIYLDFDGHVTEGTTWNNAERPTIVSPPYDTDGDPTSWSAAELSIIRSAFEAVAEDFAPFDVNVTTIEPSVDDLRNTGSGDLRWGTRVITTSDSAGLCGCGGIAYIGSFDDRVDEPVFVFNASRTGVVEAISHEVGHAMLLAHDGQSTTGYYRGHGAGDESWGPIMGASYNRTVTQWSRGEYFDANNLGSEANFGYGEDDLEVLTSLTNGNGFGYVQDDHGDTSDSATRAQTGTYTGVISRTVDVDAFLVTTAGGLTVSVTVHPSNPNLDPRVVVTGDDGQVVAISDEPGVLSGLIELPDLDAGTYTVSVAGAGWGTPLASSPTGWTSYASLGQYTLTIEAADGPVDVEAPAAPTGLAITETSANSVALRWDGNVEPDLASYVVERSQGAGWVVVGDGLIQPEFVDTTVDAASTYQYRVLAVDNSANVSSPSGSIAVTTPEPPIEPVGADTVVAETTVSGTVSGSFSATESLGNGRQVLTEASSGGRPNLRHDELDHRWQIDVTSGNHLLLIEASVVDAGDADDGFAVSWSSGASGPWVELGELTSGQGSLSADLGAPSGSVFIRITDTDRTGRNTSFDQVSVDLIELTGGEPPTEPPATVSEVTPVDGQSGVSTRPTLSWTPAAGAVEYRITVAGDVVIPVQRTSSNSIRLSGLTSGVTYQWQVEALNDLGSSSSQIFRFTTAAAPSTLVVDSISTETASASRGSRRAVVTVGVVDEYGSPVVDAEVTVQVSGSINETISGVTDTTGVVVMTTNQSAKKPVVSVCVASLSADGLSWQKQEFAC